MNEIRKFLDQTGTLLLTKELSSYCTIKVYMINDTPIMIQDFMESALLIFLPTSLKPDEAIKAIKARTGLSHF